MVNEIIDSNTGLKAASPKAASLQTMAGITVGCCPITDDIDLSSPEIIKIPLADISALGVAFKPLTAAVQSIISGAGGSGLYFVNTHGKEMFMKSGGKGFIGALKTAGGAVGGGQAEMLPLICDPTLLFMSAALMNIEKKLNDILQIQQEIAEFLQQKETARLKGNLNSLIDILNNYKYNWNNAMYKTNKHILVQEIKLDAEQSILFYRKQIASTLQKRILFHTDREVKRILTKLQSQFEHYQLSIYLYAFSSFLEVMLLENFERQYIDNTIKRISEHSDCYESLYSDCFKQMKNYSSSSIQSGLSDGLSAASKAIGNTAAKIPFLSKSRIDESLIETGGKIKKRSAKKTEKTLKPFRDVKESPALPFVENLEAVNRLYNQPTAFLFDKDNLYLCVE